MTLIRDLLQVVDGIDDSPGVLLDLNDMAPLALAKNGWSAPPPSLARSVARSGSRDGDTVAQSSYTDRAIEARLHVLGATDEQTAELIQSIARITNQDGWWLKFQRRDAVEPVFFRCKRADIVETGEYNGMDSMKTLALRIPADPFAYGLPVTGTATIANDPTAATNPMSFVFPDIQGDVATPLCVSVGDLSPAPSPNLSPKFLLSVSAHDHPATPMLYVQSAAGGGYSPWTASTPSDAAVIGGEYDRFSRPAASPSVIPSIPSVGFSDVDRGDYRVLARARASVSGSTIELRPEVNIDDFDYPWVANPTPLTTGWRWIDFGVMRLTTLPLLYDVPTLGDGGTDFARLSIRLTVPGTGAGTVDLNGVVIVPAGLDDAVVSNLTLVGGPLGDAADRPVIIDGISQRVWMPRPDPLSPADPVIRTFAGGLPAVVPGRENALYLVRSLESNDTVSTMTDLDYLYYPRYLYTRPATS